MVLVALLEKKTYPPEEELYVAASAASDLLT
jgi:hypothetical protein